MSMSKIQKKSIFLFEDNQDYAEALERLAYSIFFILFTATYLPKFCPSGRVNLLSLSKKSTDNEQNLFKNKNKNFKLDNIFMQNYVN